MDDNKEMQKELQKDTLISSNSSKENTIPPPIPLQQRCELGEIKCEDLEFKTFHFFPFLPTEIRLEIWCLCALLPRVVHINYDVNLFIGDRFKYSSPDINVWGSWRILNPITFVPVLEACKEARYECGREHKRVGYKLDMLVLPQDKNLKTLVHWEHDTFFINTNACNAIHDAEVVGPAGFPLGYGTASKIKHLAISRKLWIQWPFLEHSRTPCDCCPDPLYDGRFWFQEGIVGACTSVKDFKIVFDSERAKEGQDEPAFGKAIISPGKGRRLVESLEKGLRARKLDCKAKVSLVRRLASKPKKKKEQ